MPVIASQAIPLSSPSGYSSCATQGTRDAGISKFLGRQVLKRLRSIRIAGGQAATLRWQMLDAEGLPLSLDACALTSGESSESSASESSDAEELPGVVGTPAFGEATLVLRVREQLSSSYIAVGVELVEAESGIVQAELPASIYKQPGIYFAEIGAVLAETMLFSNVFYLIIEPGAWARKALSGPPSMAEIRLHLRSSGPEESLLLDDVRFDDAEIALAIARPVQYWNEIPPDVKRYTTKTFPHRYHWLEAICAQLFYMLEEQFRANELRYNAAGVAVDDQSKEMNYQRAGDKRWQAYLDFVRRKKAEINLNMGFGGIGSPYAY